MTTHSKKIWTLGNERSAFGRPLWLTTGALLMAMLPGCGSRIDGGNTGSETHWLQSCDNDSDCGKYSCYCGTCTLGCESNSQCTQGNGEPASCVEVGGSSDQASCGDDAPKRVCAIAEQRTTEIEVDSSPTSDSTTSSTDASTTEVEASSSSTSDNTSSSTDASTTDGSTTEVTPPVATCSSDDCEACAALDDCQAAGCNWDDSASPASCNAPDVMPPPPPSCTTDATDPSLPGVIVHLEGDTCTFPSGEGGQFRYSVELTQSLDFTTVSSNGGCGLCYERNDTETWTSFQITGEDATYCPECMGGCCPPNEAEPASLNAETSSGTINWPGLQWMGPSDTGQEPMGTFPPGAYVATVTIALPGLGEITASLPITVTQ